MPIGLGGCAHVFICLGVQPLQLAAEAIAIQSFAHWIGVEGVRSGTHLYKCTRYARGPINIAAAATAAGKHNIPTISQNRLSAFQS